VDSFGLRRKAGEEAHGDTERRRRNSKARGSRIFRDSKIPEGTFEVARKISDFWVGGED